MHPVTKIAGCSFKNNNVMENTVLGLHHITAIAGNAKSNHDFYTKILGLRLVKKTVNFDDPGTYHFYFGDEVGTPGTILTFFPWGNVQRGRNGTGMATDIGYSVPQGSLNYWKDRLAKNNVTITDSGARFGDASLTFEDPDGLKLTLIEIAKDDRKGWTGSDVPSGNVIKGFHSITLTLRSIGDTAKILTNIFGYRLLAKDGNVSRFVTEAVPEASIVDLVEAPELAHGVNAGGTVHHVAFRVKDEEVLMSFRKKIAAAGFGITPKIDRNYFFSLYFREPGGVLFELATDNPGFAIDEKANELGSNLKLPAQYEQHREEIEKSLPALA
jgi:glyoxalase family protein